MTPEEIQMVRQWMVYGWSDETIGANWHQNKRNHGCTPPQETLTETGRRLREEVRSDEERGKG
jgi:hypothetical protein